jgi:hypothetical protein
MYLVGFGSINYRIEYTARNGLTEKFQTWKSPELATDCIVAEKGINCNTHATRVSLFRFRQKDAKRCENEAKRCENKL